MIDLYQKPTDRNQLLHYSNFHPPGVFKSIPRSQLKWVSRIVNKIDTREERLNEMEDRLCQRGYLSDMVHQECINLYHDRKKDVARRLLFISQFHPFSNQINNVIRKHCSILNKNYSTIPEFYHPPLPSYRRGRTLCDSFVKSDQYSTPIPRMTFLGPPNYVSFPCLLCTQCTSMIKGKSFCLPHKGYNINIKDYFTCQSSYVILIIKCPCELVYVGETTQKVKELQGINIQFRTN